MKSSRSIQISPPIGTLRSPISGFCGWFGTIGVAERFGGPVFQHDFDRIEHGHAARRLAVEEIADFEFQQRDIGGAVELGDADAFAEIADGRGGIAAAAQAGDRRQARIVPTADEAFLHELQQLALAHHGVGEVQPREFDLARLATAPGSFR